MIALQERMVAFHLFEQMDALNWQKKMVAFDWQDKDGCLPFEPGMVCGQSRVQSSHPAKHSFVEFGH